MLSAAAALVSAAVLSTLIYPLIGLRIRPADPRDRERVAMV